MELRLIKAILPASRREAVSELLASGLGHEAWIETISEDRILVHILETVGGVEGTMDRLQEAFEGSDGFRMLVLPVAASVPVIERPRREEEEEENGEGEGRDPDTTDEDEAENANGAAERRRVSRAELHAAISGSADLSWVFVMMAALSAVVAALGLLGDNVAIVIGAMVIAPLLGPNVALSMATTLADRDLAVRAIGANVVGAGVAFAVSAVLGFLIPVDPTVGEIAARTRVGMADLGLALAAGSAGALAFTSGVSATLIGVMVAVALLPPVVVFGLLIGAGHPALAMGALLLALTNIISLNLAGVATFLVQGIRPANWWEAERARRASLWALLLWLGLLAALTAVIVLAEGDWPPLPGAS